MSTSPARKQRRLSDREAARRARQAAAAKAPPTNGATAASGDPDLLAQATAAMEANGAAAAPPGGAGGAPPLTMDQIPAEQQRALSGLLQRAQGAGAGDDATAAADAKANGKRLKKFITLEKELAGLLASPSVPAYMAGDEFCGEHFAVEGPIVAQQLTMISEVYPSTYETMHWLAKQGVLLVVLPTLIKFVLKPAAHHGLPVPESARRHYGIPSRHNHIDPLVAVA